MFDRFIADLQSTLAGIEADDLMKRVRLITSPQGAKIAVGGREVINLCANNYLGLADHPDLIRVTRDVMDEEGFGMASVRFLRGTQARIRTKMNAALTTDQLDRALAAFGKVSRDLGVIK